MKKNDRINSIISYGLAPVIVLVIFAVILAIKGIWPFGSETIDYYDMAQQVAAQYMQIYDEIHLAKSSVYDWYSLLGHGIPGGTYFSILNLLYYFVPRDMILETFSIMMAVRMMLMALGLRIYIKKEIPSCPELYGTILSVGYAFCGFTLMQYTILNWFDFAILMPFVMLYTQRLLREGQMAGFVVCMSLALMNYFYVPVMMLLFVFLASGLYCAIYGVCGKKNNAQPGRIHVLRLGIGVALSLLISAWSWMPKVLQESGSMRFGNEAESSLMSMYIKIITHVVPDYTSRWWALLGLSFAMALTVVGIVRDIKKKNFQRIIFVAGSIFIVCAELVFENIQLIWHFGSYVNYPVRNGFLIYLVFSLAAAVYASEIPATAVNELKRILKPAFIPGMIVFALVSVLGVYLYKSNAGMSIYTAFKMTVLLMMASFVIYMGLILFKGGKLISVSVFLIAAEIIVYGVFMFGKPLYITGYAEEKEQEGDYIRISQDLDAAFDLEDSYLDRLKNPDGSLNTNYGQFIKRGTLSGWIPGTPADVIGAAGNMGYSTQYTRTLDTGGNVLTDAIIHVTQVISHVTQDSSLYNLVSKTNAVMDYATLEEREYGLYDCNYVLPFGTILRDADAVEKIKKAQGSVSFTNAVYRGISGDDEDISTVIDFSDVEAGRQIEVEGKNALYLCGNALDCEYENALISVNGRNVRIPSIKEPDNILYPAHFNNNTIFLGTFENEPVNVSVDVTEVPDFSGYNFVLYSVNLDKLFKLCSMYEDKQQDMTFIAGKRELTGSVTAKQGEYLLLPIGYDKNWNVWVNGDSKELIRINGLMMAIPLAEGNNSFRMNYYPKNMKYGFLLSAVGILIAMLLFVAKNRLENLEKSIDKVLILVYTGGWAIVILGMYICPMLYAIYFYAHNLIS